MKAVKDWRLRFHLSNKNNMSIIQRPGKSKPFQPSEYMTMIMKLNVLQLLNMRYNDEFIVFGYYTRNVIVCGEIRTYKIMRIRSKRDGRTHAVLFDFMVPYHQISSDDLTAVISDDTDDLPYSDAYIRWLREVIRLKGITDYVSACRAFCRGYFISDLESLVLDI